MKMEYDEAQQDLAHCCVGKQERKRHGNAGGLHSISLPVGRKINCEQ